MEPRKKLFIAGALLAALAIQVGAFIVVHSNTYDEVAYIGAGLSYVKSGDLALDIHEHPPLMKYVIGVALLPFFDEPVSASNHYQSGFNALYRSGKNPQFLLAVARLPTLFLALLLASFVFLWAQRWHGYWGGIVALAALALEPTVVAHSGLATFDIPMTAFLFVATYFLVKWLETAARAPLLWSGFFIGLAIATKITAIAAYIWLPLLLFVAEKKIRRPQQLKMGLVAWGLIPLVIIILAYQVVDAPRFLDMFLKRFGEVFTSPQGTPNFFHGEIQSGGWRSFYLKAFCIKSALPFLLLLALGALTKPWSRRSAFILIPAITMFCLASLSQKQQGIRYLLPAYPFLCVWLGRLTDRRIKRPAQLKYAVIALVGWCALEAAVIFPKHLSYFNQLVGGPKNGHKWLVDSNLDWGQDFIRLRHFLRERGSPEVVLAGFFTGDPTFFIGPHQTLLPDPNVDAGFFLHMNSSAPATEVLVVSATFLEGLWLSDPNLFEWLRNCEPMAQVGHSLMVYDVTKDAVSHAHLASIYMRQQRKDFAARHFALARRHGAILKS